MTLQGFSDWASLVWAIAMTVSWVGAIGAMAALHQVHGTHSKWLVMLTERVGRLEGRQDKAFTGHAGGDRSFVMAVGTGPISSLMGKPVPMPPHAAVPLPDWLRPGSGIMTAPPKEGSKMRSEAEVRAMIAEIEAIRAGRGGRTVDFGTADAVIAALQNVLTGPVAAGPCACMGPTDLCRCQIKQLGLKRTVEDG